MSIIQVDGGGRLENVTVQNPGDDYGIEVTAGGKLRDVTIFGAQPTAQIIFSGNRARARDIACEGDGDGIVISGHRNIIDLTTGSTTDIAATISGNDNIITLHADSPDEDGVLLSGLRNQLQIHVISCGEDGINISGDHNHVRGVLSAPSRHGCIISGDANTVDLDVIEPGGLTDNTYDAFALESTAARNRVRGHATPRSTGNQTRRAVTLTSGTADNHIVDVDFGDVSAYGTTPAYSDAGSNQNTYPADATYGDNWTQ